MRNDFFSTVVAECEERAAIWHHRARPLCNGDKAVNADVHRHLEVFKASINIAAAQLILIRKANRVDNEINRGPARGQCLKGTVERGHIAHITVDQEITAQLFSKWAHPLAKCIALIAERQFGAFGM